MKELSRLLAEFLGTWIITFTLVSAVLSGSDLAPLSIAASLMVSTYALGGVSGANFNPAVTLALLVCNKAGHGYMQAPEAIQFMVVQFAAGAAAASSASAMYESTAMGKSSSVHYWGHKTIDGGFFKKDKVQPKPQETIALYHVKGHGAMEKGDFNFMLKQGSYKMSTTDKSTGVVSDVAGDYGWANVFTAECIYTALLVFVLLNVGTCRDEGNSKNNYFGLAIGFVFSAAMAAAQHISGAFLNPAVSFGVTLSSMIYSDIGVGSAFKNFGIFAGAEFFGSLLAFGLFFGCRHHIFKEKQPEFMLQGIKQEISLPSKLLSEFSGTFYLVLTVVLVCSASIPSIHGIVGIAASLMVMIYSLAAVSGGNFNPAVSVGLLLIGELEARDCAAYVVAQLLGGAAASGVGFLLEGNAWHLGLVGTMEESSSMLFVAAGSWGGILAAELFYTFLLVFTVLNVAVADGGNQYYGLAIAFVVLAGGVAVGGISGGCFNPAVAIGIDFGPLFGGIAKTSDYKYGYGFAYLVIEMLGALLAALCYRITREMEEEDYEMGSMAGSQNGSPVGTPRGYLSSLQLPQVAGQTLTTQGRSFQRG